MVWIDRPSRFLHRRRRGTPKQHDDEDIERGPWGGVLAPRPGGMNFPRAGRVGTTVRRTSVARSHFRWLPTAWVAAAVLGATLPAFAQPVVRDHRADRDGDND